MTSRVEPTKQRLNEIFEYKNGMLFWKKKSSSKSHVNIGERAGFFTNDGYRAVRVDMKIYKEHRLIWIMHNGEIPNGYEIDHQFGDRLDNRIEILRCGTPSNNQHNRNKNKNNTSGYKGVYFHTKTGKPIARIQSNGVFKYIGTYNTPEEAFDAYKKEAIKLHGEFAKF